MAPAGQLWSTATDMAKWAAFLADPAPAVLPRETVDEMCAPVVISDLGVVDRRATGWARSSSGSASGSSWGTAVRCPATWRISRCIGGAGSG